MMLIRWEEIRRSTSVARMRGNVGMIKAFYESLLNDALFDDQGAWSLDPKKFFDLHH